MFIIDVATLYQIVNAFREFEYNISGEPVANANISLVHQNIAAFYVANKIEQRIFFKQWVCALREQVALSFFLTNVHQTCTGLIYFEDVACKKGTENGKLIQVFGFA